MRYLTCTPYEADKFALTCSCASRFLSVARILLYCLDAADGLQVTDAELVMQMTRSYTGFEDCVPMAAGY